VGMWISFRYLMTADCMMALDRAPPHGEKIAALHV
jgi:hypothetical protein